MWLVATIHDRTYSIHTEKSQHAVPVKGQVVNISASVDRTGSVVTTQLCCCNEGSHRHCKHKWACLRANKVLFTKAGSGPDLACGLSLPTADTEHRTGSSNLRTTVHHWDELGHLYLIKPQFLHLI